jgi:hypothetical protein
MRFGWMVWETAQFFIFLVNATSKRFRYLKHHAVV